MSSPKEHIDDDDEGREKQKLKIFITKKSHRQDIDRRCHTGNGSENIATFKLLSEKFFG
jgi:hypothetical protein